VTAAFRSRAGHGLLVQLPSLLRLLLTAQELKEDTELASLSTRMTMTVSNVQLPADEAGDIIAALMALSKEGSWHSRCRALRMLQSLVFRNLFYAPVRELVELLAELVADPQLEVRQLASQTLSGLIRCGLVRNVTALEQRFRALAATPLPKRPSKKRATAVGADGVATPKADPEASRTALLQRHGGVLGLHALVSAYPYEMPDWMPDLLIFIGERTNDPEPIR
jgi:proteasome activator subunit 4